MPKYTVQIGGSSFDVDSPTPLPPEQVAQTVMQGLKQAQLPVQVPQQPYQSLASQLPGALGSRLMGDVPKPANSSPQEYATEKVFDVLGGAPRAMRAGLNAPMGSPEQMTAAWDVAMQGLELGQPMRGGAPKTPTRPVEAFPPTPPPVAPKPDFGMLQRGQREAETAYRALNDKLKITKEQAASEGHPELKGQVSYTPELQAAHEKLMQANADLYPIDTEWPAAPLYHPAKEALPAHEIPPGDGPVEGPAAVTDASRAKIPRSEALSKEGADPDKPLMGTYARKLHEGMVEKLQNWVKEITPRTAEIMRKYPETNIISATERFKTSATKAQLERTASSEFRDMVGVTEDEYLDAEQAGYDELRTSNSLASAIRAVREKSPFTAERMEKFYNQDWDEIQNDRKRLNLDSLPEKLREPLYLPRQLDFDPDAITYIGGRYQRGGGLRSTLGNFVKPRANNLTALEEATKLKTEFRDPRVSIMNYEFLKDELHAAADYVTELKDGGMLYFTEKAAKAAAGEAHEVRDLIPGKSYWVPDKAIAQFLKDNFRSEESKLFNPVRFANTYFRNPNLFNPIPHTKNIMWLYKLSGGRLSKLPAHLYEYKYSTQPERLKLFEDLIPHTKGNRTGQEILKENRDRITGADKFGSSVKKLVDLAHNPTQKYLWEKVDPALKYARWVEYMEKDGLSPQNAANQTMRALVRYSERGQMLDFLRSIPGNFYTPWRWGNFAASIKAAKDRPLQTALLVAGVDFIRWSFFQKTGWWLSLPLDHIEVPIYLVAQAAGKGSRGDVKGAGTDLLYASTSSLVPGVTMMARQWLDPLSLNNIQHMYWGMGQVVDGLKHVASGDPIEMLKSLLDAIGSYEPYQIKGKHFVGSHPKTFGAMTPESVIEPTWKIKRAEQAQAAKEKKEEAKRVQDFWKPIRHLETILKGNP